MKPDTAVCPCEEVVHPRVPTNLPRLPTIDYRVGDFNSFRDALLRAREGEQALRHWRPKGTDDLALQLLEWWAYLADVLTFYNERALHDALLRTASFPDSIRRIVRVLGYRPRPGIAATGVLAALTDSVRPFVIPEGFAIRAATPPGGSEQIFEVDSDIEIGRLGRRLPPSAGFPPPHQFTPIAGPTDGSSGDSGDPGATVTPGDRVLIGGDGKLRDSTPAHVSSTPKSIEEDVPFEVAFEGVVSGLQSGDRIIIIPPGWDGSGHVLATVRAVSLEWNAYGTATTIVTLVSGNSLDDYHGMLFLQSTKQAHLWLYHVRYGGATGGGSSVGQIAGAILNPIGAALDGLFGGGPSVPPQDPTILSGGILPVFMGGGEGFAHLEAVVRGINPGDPVLFESRGTGISPALVRVSEYSEEIWYANAPSNPGYGPPVGPPQPQGTDLGLISDIFGGGEEEPEGPIPIPHTKIVFNKSASIHVMASALTTVVVHYGWQKIGDLATEVDRTTTSETIDVNVDPGAHFPPEIGATNETAIPVIIEDASGKGTPSYVGRTAKVPAGSTLEQPDIPPMVGPLRALLHLLPVSRGKTVARDVLGSGDPLVSGQQFVLARSPLTYLKDPTTPSGYRSTLRVRVDGVEWHEVASFYRQPAHAQVFVTYEDDDQRTHVRFGDGEHGKRLPAGTKNVVATYRHGSGAEVPEQGTLTTPVKPRKGLREIRNPLPMAGGADPDPSEHIRRYAPSSVLSFGRAVSMQDYEVAARLTPGVARARADWVWDVPSQRNLVKVFVGDDKAAEDAVRERLRAITDPNLPVLVTRAEAIKVLLRLSVVVHPDHDLDTVRYAVQQRLLDERAQPFGRAVVAVGQVVYDSHVSAACLSVPGVVAIHQLSFEVGPQVLEGERHDPGTGAFFRLSPDPIIAVERSSHGD